jgi:hypothetical protein
MDEEHGPVARGMAGHRGRSMAPIGSAAMKTSVAAYLALPIGLAMGYALQRHLGAKRTGSGLAGARDAQRNTNFRLGCRLRQNVWGLDYRHASVCRRGGIVGLVLIQ